MSVCTYDVCVCVCARARICEMCVRVCSSKYQTALQKRFGNKSAPPVPSTKTILHHKPSPPPLCEIGLTVREGFRVKV
jgi:3-deoxy-D-manno-octulosonic-acid transferase